MKKFMYEKNLTEKEVEADPKLIPDFQIKHELFSKKTITLQSIEKEI
jgi:hypothetical protein